MIKESIIANKSFTYIIPLMTKDIAISEFHYLLINSYIKFNPSLDIEYPIGLLYETEDSSAWNMYCEYLRSSNLFHKEYIINNNRLFIFNFPDKFIKEYKLFKEGKYSQFSSEAKSLIISYSAQTYKYPPLIEDLTGVLWKHKSRRVKMEKELGLSLPDGCELASKIEYENETFKFNE